MPAEELPIDLPPIPEPEGVPATRAAHQQRVFRALQYIHQNLGQPLDLAQLSRVANLSPSHLGCVFRGLIGESVYQHIRRLRLERAATFLRLTSESVLDVALACGFDSHEAFTRAFTRGFGCSPRAFRRKHHLASQLPAPTNLHYHPTGPPATFTPIPDQSRKLDVRLVELPALRLASVRFVGPYRRAYLAWPKLLWWAWRRGRLGPAARLFGLSYDDELVTPEELQRYDAALVVEDDFKGDGEIVAQTIEAGLFAVATVIGNFDDYWQASETLICQWIPQNGLSFRAMYSLDRYHVPGHLRNPLAILAAGLRRLHVDMHVPVGPGPFGRSLLN